HQGRAGIVVARLDADLAVLVDGVGTGDGGLVAGGGILLVEGGGVLDDLAAGGGEDEIAAVVERDVGALETEADLAHIGAGVDLDIVLGFAVGRLVINQIDIIVKVLDFDGFVVGDVG